jgi:hypothetical protein
MAENAGTCASGRSGNETRGKSGDGNDEWIERREGVVK